MSLSKVQATNLIKDNLQSVRNWLHIKNSLKISVHILSSKSSKTVTKNNIIIKSENKMGWSWTSIAANAADIIIYYNEHTSEKRFISTLIHELLHVKFAKLTNCITLDYNKGDKLEEELVSELEMILIEGWMLRTKR